jgi:selenocysteine lyase/cysteine desulfurase
LNDRGGLVRVGLAPYTTEGELERLVDAVTDLAHSGPSTPRSAALEDR